MAGAVPSGDTEAEIADKIQAQKQTQKLKIAPDNSPSGGLARFKDVQSKSRQELADLIRDTQGFRPRVGETGREAEYRVRLELINKKEAVAQQIKDLKKKMKRTKGEERKALKQQEELLNNRHKTLDNRINTVIKSRLVNDPNLLKFTNVSLWGTTEKFYGSKIYSESHKEIITKPIIDAGKILGVTAKTPIAEGKQKFKELARRYHPDNKLTGNAQKFREIKTAYDHYAEMRARYFNDGRAGGWDQGKWVGED
jgi:curved DNA-binding protein CbpA